MFTIKEFFFLNFDYKTESSDEENMIADMNALSPLGKRDDEGDMEVDDQHSEDESEEEDIDVDEDDENGDNDEEDDEDEEEDD